jgi:hypothetical protein
LSVSPQYRTRSKIQLTQEPLSCGIFYASVLVSAIIGSIELVSIALALFLLRLLVQLLIINVSARRLNMRRYGLGLIVYDIILPLITLYIMLTQPLQKKPLYW